MLKLTGKAKDRDEVVAKEKAQAKAKAKDTPQANDKAEGQAQGQDKANDAVKARRTAKAKYKAKVRLRTRLWRRSVRADFLMMSRTDAPGGLSVRVIDLYLRGAAVPNECTERDMALRNRL